MKIKNILMAFGVAAAGLMTSSCVNDLDLEPIDPSSINSSTFKDDPEAYMNRVLAEVYISFVNHGPNNNSQVSGFDGGMSSYARALFNLQELPTDEAFWMSTSDAALYTLSFGNITSDNEAIFGTYSRLIINVALCNNFIQTVNEGLFSLPDNLKETANDYVRQCKILRSICYFNLIDLFGSVPYADENDPMGTNAPQLSREEIFNRVTTTLEEVVAEYGPGKQTPALNYVGKDVAEGLLVRFYLNAEVFTGKPAWDKCLTHANNLIGAHQGAGFQGSGLAEHYQQCFGANNYDYALGGANAVNEILWILPQQTDKLLSYGGATLMTLGATNKTDEDLHFFNIGNAWKCFKGLPNLVNMFEWNDATKATSPDSRVMLWHTSADGYVNDMPFTTNNDWLNNGYQTNKYINRYVLADGSIDMDNTPGAQGDGYVTTGFVGMRLSEIYLSAAEAILHGAGAKADALRYVNYVRQRAGVRPWADTDLNLDNLLNERCRELYHECTRRTDLIRGGKWTSGYNWAWKNSLIDGANYPAHYNLYPIPSQIINQSSYVQNPGY